MSRSAEELLSIISPRKGSSWGWASTSDMCLTARGGPVGHHHQLSPRSKCFCKVSGRTESTCMPWVWHQLLCATKLKLQSALRRQASRRDNITRTCESHATKGRRSQAALRSALPRVALKPIKMQPHRLRSFGHHMIVSSAFASCTLTCNETKKFHGL